MGHYEAIGLWERVREDLSGRVETNNTVAGAYLSYLVPQDLDDTTLTVITSSAAAKERIEGRYLPLIDDAVVGALGSRRQIRIVVQDNGQFVPSSIFPYPVFSSSAFSVDALSAPPPASAPASPVVPAVGFPAAVAHAAPPVSLASSAASFVPAASTFLPVQASVPIDTPSEQEQPPKFVRKTFDNFVKGSSNDFAYSAAQGVAESPGQRYNPLFIYGRSGLGKTHLLLAIKDSINQVYPGCRVVFAQTSDFVNDFTSAMASINKDLTDFRVKYHMCDVLLLDDVQYLEGKESTTNALFDIFNLFVGQRKQIVLSADRAPNELHLDNRFGSRFAQGLTAGIQPPDFEMKMAIFNNLFKFYCYQFDLKNASIPQEVADHIIELSSSNIRELEGATSTIVAYIAHRRSEGKNSIITVEEAEQIVNTVFLHSETKQIKVSNIQKEVERHFNISHADMIGPRRSQNISYPRQVAMYLSRRLTTKSYPEIAELFGGKDHTSVIYACQNIDKKIMEDVFRKREVEGLAEIILA